MRPAFDSPGQTAAFGLLLLFLLAAPCLTGKKFLPPREQAYASEGWTWGPYPWIQKQIFGETNDIDIAFMGSSRMDWAIDTPYLQEKLDEQMGRKTVVRTISWSGAGFDTLYFVTKDLLEHRHVKTLVFYDESPGLHPNFNSVHWFWFGDAARALAGLPPREQGVFYFAAMVGMPEHILELLTPHLPEPTPNPIPNYYETAFHAANPETRLGSVSARLGFAAHQGDNTNFESYVPETGATPADVRIYNTTTSSNFLFANHSLAAWQISFARQFGALIKKNRVNLVYLHLPTIADNNSSLIKESYYWPDLLHTDMIMMGILPGSFFGHLPELDIERLYCDPGHLNQNGQKYFTALITPSVLQAYENHISP